MFSTPRQEWTVTDPEKFFSPTSPTESGDNGKTDPDVMDDIVFTAKDIEQACAELRSTAAAGPDGVPAMLLKMCRRQLAAPLRTLWRESLDSGTIPPELLLVLVTPIHKGGSRAAPKNYRLRCLRGSSGGAWSGTWTSTTSSLTTSMGPGP